MRSSLLTTLLTLALAFASPPSLAAEKGAKGKSGGNVAALYRYRNAQGVLVMESSIPPEYATKGYQILNSFGQVIQDVPAVTLLTDEERKAKNEMEAMSSRKDSELRKLYSAPQDAERLRDRQLEALGLKVDHAKGQLAQTMAKRKTAVEQAARMERAGNTVSPAARATIEKLTAQVAAEEREIKSYETEQKRVREQFEPIIERLRVIYPDKAGQTVTGAPAAPAGGAAVAPPPAGAPLAAPKPGAAPMPPAAAQPAGSPQGLAVKMPVTTPAPVPAKPVPAVAGSQGKPVTAPVAVQPVPLQPKPVAVPVPQPAPVAAAPAVPVKPVVVPPKPAPVAVAPAAKPQPAPLPPVAPVTKVKAKSTAPAASAEEKAEAKAKAKELLDLDEEPRTAGGLRPTGVR
jgi:hypothetical protein